MSAKAEISWSGRNDEGVKRQVYAQRVGGEWIFYEREKRFEQWQLLKEPPLEDWLELLDAVRRRITRRRSRPQEEDRIKCMIRDRFPDSKL